MRLLRGCLATLAVLLLVCVIGVGALQWYVSRPFPARQPETFIEIDRGTSSRAIAKELADAGLLASPGVFLALRAMHPASALQAGEYRFGLTQSPAAIFDTIRHGRIFFEELAVPEGSNKFDIARLLEGVRSVKSNEFLTAAADPALVADLDPLAPSLEGYLFPSTYRLTRKTTAHQLCATMVAEFRRHWNEMKKGEVLGSVHQIVTIASLVERETAVPTERPLVAAVFANRLKAGMPLQCDPTVVYAAQIGNRYRGVIHKSDLANPDAYNTYAHPGLPPGPIANPGIAALQAALQPASAGYLYFVALPNGQGSHHFSNTLAEHERAVAEYRHSR